jgi:hypothetical protein
MSATEFGRLETVTEQFGAPLGQSLSPYNKERSADLTDRANWDEATGWLVSEAHSYASVLSAILAEPA